MNIPTILILALIGIALFRTLLRLSRAVQK